MGGLWEAFTKCQWVEPEQEKYPGNRGELWFHEGPAPPPEYKMRNWKNVVSTGHKVWM